ncbi:MAG: hypothetical protein ACYC1S_15615, partial [Gemmatimonadaceae bacterium]
MPRSLGARRLGREGSPGDRPAVLTARTVPGGALPAGRIGIDYVPRVPAFRRGGLLLTHHLARKEVGGPLHGTVRAG